MSESPDTDDDQEADTVKGEDQIYKGVAVTSKPYTVRKRACRSTQWRGRAS